MRAAAAAVTAGGLGIRLGLGVIPRHTQNNLSHFVQCALARALFGSAAFWLASHRSALLRGVPSRLPPLQNSCFVQSGSVPRLGGLHPCASPPPASPHPTALRSAGGLPLSVTLTPSQRTATDLRLRVSSKISCRQYDICVGADKRACTCYDLITIAGSRWRGYSSILPLRSSQHRARQSARQTDRTKQGLCAESVQLAPATSESPQSVRQPPLAAVAQQAARSAPAALCARRQPCLCCLQPCLALPAQPRAAARPLDTYRNISSGFSIPLR